MENVGAYWEGYMNGASDMQKVLCHILRENHQPILASSVECNVAPWPEHLKARMAQYGIVS